MTQIEQANGLTVYPDGTKQWFRNGELHRDDGPAIEDSDGSKYWCRNGRLHRDDGPAIEDSDGTKEYWWMGEKILKKVWDSRISRSNRSKPTAGSLKSTGIGGSMLSKNEISKIRRVAKDAHCEDLYKALHKVGDDDTKVFIENALHELLSPAQFRLVVGVFKMATCT